MGFLVSKGNLLLLLWASIFPGKFEKALLPLLGSFSLFSLSDAPNANPSLQGISPTPTPPCPVATGPLNKSLSAWLLFSSPCPNSWGKG